MKKIVIALCVIGLMLIPSTVSMNISTSTKTKSSPDSEPEGTTLITEFGKNGTLSNVTEFDSDGNIIWQLTGLESPMDAERLSNGNTLITLHGGNKVIEYDRAGDIIWLKAGLYLPTDAERLSNGNTLIAQYGNGRVTEVDEEGNVVWEVAGLHKPMDAERLPNGNTLIAEGELWPDGKVLEFDSAGNEVWNITELDGPVDVERLYNDSYGNITLITEHPRFKGGNVTEYDENGTIVWQIKGLAHPQDAERLPNGNTLIPETGILGPNRVIEYSPEGTKLWLIDGLQYPVDVERLPYQPSPSIEIINPKEGYFHILGRSLFPFPKAFVYGPIDVKVNITSFSGVEKVQFYINDELKKTIIGDETSYEYRWAPMMCGRYTIKAVVYDNAGQNASDSITLFKWRAHPVLLLAGLIPLLG